ncbi:hypothetical protein HYX12_04810 [Candidatus Woesearchaeota archaeon]|nr:hypothetical protein [Candidatus Woesearchaeota archaeon]
MTRSNITRLGRALAKVNEERVRLMERSTFLSLEEVLDIAERIPLERWIFGKRSPPPPIEQWFQRYKHRGYLFRHHRVDIPNSAFAILLVREGLEKSRFYHDRGNPACTPESGQYETSLLLYIKAFGDSHGGASLFGVSQAESVNIWTKESPRSDRPIEFNRIEELYDRVHEVYFKRFES